jgi:hypothetical protein
MNLAPSLKKSLAQAGAMNQRILIPAVALIFFAYRQ